jgi:hypothetical protein
MGDGNESVARRVCAFVEGRRAAAVARVPVDVGVTRTDFSDPARPVQRLIGPDGAFTDRQSDGVRTDEECYQAAIRLGELSTHRVSAVQLRRFRASAALQRYPLLALLQKLDVRIHWLPTDPVLHPERTAPDAAQLMMSFIEKSDRLWNSTAAIRNLVDRRKAFALRLYERMQLPRREGGFGMTFFNPSKDVRPKTDHPFYSLRNDCIGSWLYGALCERHGINATPVQRFTDDDGNVRDHVLVGLHLDPKDPKKMVFVSFQEGEQGFDIVLQGKSTWASISRLELLAYIHLTYAFLKYPDDKERQLQELRLAHRYAPSNYLVHYQLGVWHWNQGLRQEAIQHYRRAVVLNPTYLPARSAIKDYEEGTVPR